MSPKALGYVVVGSDKLDDWRNFATRILGMQPSMLASSLLALRMDERARRVLVDAKLEEGRFRAGWEYADQAVLDALVARLEKAGIAVTHESAALAESRGVKALISFEDPCGNRVEAFHGGIDAAEHFVPSRSISGFRTGALGMGHAVLTVKDIASAAPFYQDVLGFRLTDYMETPFKAHFFHVNARHHSLAMIETGANGLHHLMFECLSLDDIGQGYDLALAEEQRVSTTLGRHSNDFMTSFYMRSPSPFLVEYGWGGRNVDPATWRANKMDCGPSLWGHDREWLPADKRRMAREMAIKAAADARRAPVYVLDGNYQVQRDK